MIVNLTDFKDKSQSVRNVSIQNKSYNPTGNSLLWGEEKEATIIGRLNKYVKAGKLIRPRRGFFAKDKNYDRLELATRIYTPAYISFETVLTHAGINLQYYSNIFVASYLTREIEVGGQKISYVRIKDYVLSDTSGIDHTSNVSIATKERAFLDRIKEYFEYYKRTK